MADPRLQTERTDPLAGDAPLGGGADDTESRYLDRRARGPGEAALQELLDETAAEAAAEAGGDGGASAETPSGPTPGAGLLPDGGAPTARVDADGNEFSADGALIVNQSSGAGDALPLPLVGTLPGAVRRHGAAVLDAADAVQKDVRGGLVEAPIRGLARGATEGVRNMLRTIEDLSVWLNDNVADLSDLETGIAAIDNPAGTAADALPDLPKPETVTGQVIEWLAEFATGMKGVGKLLPKAPGGAAKLARTEIQAAGADMTAFPAHEKRLADLWSEMGLPENELIDWLESDEDEGNLEARIKRGAEGLLIGAPLQGFVEAAKAVRAWRQAGRPGAADGAEAAGQDGAVRRALRGAHTEETDVVLTEAQKRDFLHLGDPNAELVRVSDRPATGAEKDAAAAKITDRLSDGAGGVVQLPAAARIFAAAERARLAQSAREGGGGSVPRDFDDLQAEAEAIVRAEGGRYHATVLEQIRRIKAPRGRRARSLTQWLANEGGLIDSSGELKAMGITPASRPGLVSKKGMNFDDAALRAWENGFFDDLPGERPDINDFLNALRDDFEGLRVRIHPDDRELADRAADLKALEDELGAAGVDIDAPEAALIAQLDRLAGRGGAADEGAAARTADDLDAETAALETAGAIGVDLGGRRVFVNFARIDTADDVKAVIGHMADAAKAEIDAAGRGVQSNARTKELADDLGMSVGDLLARRPGEVLNAETALAARRLMAASAAKLLQLAERAADPNAGPLDQFAFRKAQAVHMAIQAEVLGARREAGRALQAWRIPADAAGNSLREVNRLLTEMGGPALQTELARRLKMLADQGATAGALNTFARAAATASKMDMLREVWINGLLSSPQTHVVNIASNLSVVAQQIYERGAAAGIGRLAGRAAGDRVEPGEAAAMTHGLAMGLRDAFRLSWKALKTGETDGPVKIEGRPDPALTAENLGFSEAGGVGRAVDLIGSTFRVPGRLLMAEDQFFKSIGYRMELHARGVRQAAAEGLDGADLKRRAAEIVANPPPDLKVAATDAALYNTFNNAPGWFGQAAMRFRGGQSPWNPMPFIVPFMRTPVNIARYGFERTPLAPLVGQWRADIAAGGARRDLALARMATGSAVMLVAADLADLGVISGSGPKDPGQRAAWLRQGNLPYSIRLGGRSYSFNRMDPFGMTMGLAADIAEAMRHGDIDEEDVDEWHELMAMAIGAVAKNALSKTYLSGIAEFMEMTGDPDRYSEGYIEKFVASFAPMTALQGNVARTVDPVLRDPGDPFEAVQARLAVLSSRLYARRDKWGREIRSDSGLGRAVDFLSPVRSRAQVESPIDAEIQRLGMNLGKIPKRVEWNGVAVSFRRWRDVYDEYVRLAGNGLEHPVWRLGLKDLLDRVVSGDHPLSAAYRLKSGGPDGGKAAWIRKMDREYRALARREIMNDPRFSDFRSHIEDRMEESRQKELDAMRGKGG